MGKSEYSVSKDPLDPARSNFLDGATLRVALDARLSSPPQPSSCSATAAHFAVRFFAVGLVLLTVGIGVTFGLPSRIAARQAAPIASTTQVRFAAPAPPLLSAEAAYAFDATVGTELYAVKADDRRAPASLTKVATALVVLEHADLNATVAIDSADIGDPTESQVGLEVGDELSVRDLLVGLLVPSGNDAARALARETGEGLPNADEPTVAFVAEMNRLAASLNLDNTHFANPSGLDQDDHYSSARDLARLAAFAMEDPLFAEIVGTVDATLDSRMLPDGYVVSTTNDLLFDGIVEGIKTGTTERAGGCVISAISIGENLVIAVVLGSPVETSSDGTTVSPGRFEDTRAILDALPIDYLWVDPNDLDQIAGLNDELDAWEAKLPAGPAIVVPVDRSSELRYRLQLGEPGPADTAVGRVLFFVGDSLLSERPVVQAA